MQPDTELTSDLIELDGVSFARGDHVIYDNVSLNIPKGKITAIMGPSGTGKTTLLRLIGGQLKPHKGSIWYNLSETERVDISQLNRSKLFNLRERMSMLFQNGALFTGILTYQTSRRSAENPSDYETRNRRITWCRRQNARSVVRRNGKKSRACKSYSIRSGINNV